MLGDMWRSKSDEEKRPYQEHERAEREIYKQKIARWREQKGANEKVTSGQIKKLLSFATLSPIIKTRA